MPRGNGCDQGSGNSIGLFLVTIPEGRKHFHSVPVLKKELEPFSLAYDAKISTEQRNQFAGQDGKPLPPRTSLPSNADG